MNLKFSGEFLNDGMIIQLAENKGQLYFGKSTSLEKQPELKEKESVYLYFKEKVPVALFLKPEKIEAQDVVVITPPWDILRENLAEKMVTVLEKNGLSIEKNSGFLENNSPKMPKEVTDYQKNIFLLLKNFGYILEKKKKLPAKAQHRWNKEVAQLTFFIDYSGAKGKAQWVKRNELVLKKGAILLTTPPLNKDGSLGYSVRFAEKVRDENQGKFTGNTTTEDIIFKSVNELGLFLYYGNTNGWLVLKDKNGVTIDEYTVVK